MKKNVILIFVAVCVLFVSAIVCLAVRELRKSDFFETPSKPEITYGEFAFKLEYELNGERFVVEDVWVCEFDGFGANEGTGRYRKWKGKVKGTGEDKIVLLNVKNPTMLGSLDASVSKQIIYFLPGSASYYMGDSTRSRNEFPDALYWEYSFPFTTVEGKIEAEEMQEKFNLKLISWKIEEPIENNFK